MRNDAATIARSLRLVHRADPWRTWGTLALAIFAGLMPVLATWATKLLVDAVADEASLSSVGLPVAILFTASLLGQFLGAYGELLRSDLDRTIHLTTSDEAFSHLNEFGGIRYFEDPDFQDSFQLGLGSGGNAHSALLGSITGLVQGVVTLVGFIVALASVDLLAAGLVLLTAVPQFRAELTLGQDRFALLMQMTPVERLAMVYQRVQSEATAAKELRLFGLGDYFRGRMLSEVRTAQAGQRRVDRKTLRVRTWMDLLALLPIGTALGLAVYRVSQGSISAGDVVLYLAAVQSATGASQSMAVTWAMLKEQSMTAAAYFVVMDTEPDIRRRIGAPVGPLETLSLRDVWFRYRPDLPWVLQGVDLDLDAGASLAIVGINGAGKSTLIKLICRLYEPERGAVLWNGTDIRELDLDSYRNRLGAVFQDFVSYDLTVAENVEVGDLEAAGDLPRIRRALDEVHLTETIDALPLGLHTRLSRSFRGEQRAELGLAEPDPDAVPEDEDTWIDAPGLEPMEGFGTSYLSGGQWQRLALARMLMRAGRDLLILDEPSSGLDPRAEAEVNRTVERLSAGSARILVSHRLNTVRFADQIVALDGGVISEHGSHDELMAARGQYAELFDLQRHGYQ